ncbi:RHS repeat-associated core domain-containing protein [Saccharopolyspora sp. NPDC002578]
MANPLVAEREDSTKSFSGVPILESVDETKKAIEQGDWAAGVLGATGTALDALGMAMDPFGSILAAGVGWLMEHVGPVSDALDALTGDPDEIKAHSETWKNISGELAAISTDLTDMVKADTAGWTGQAGDAYRKRSEDTATLLEAAKSAADGASSGIGTAGEVVAAVRTLVRDIIAELVGHLVSWALQVIATLGIGLTWVVPQVIAEVAKVASKIADITMKLVKAMKALVPMLKKLGKGFGEASDALKKIKSDGSSGPPPKSPPPGGGSRGGPDGPASNNSANAEKTPDPTPPPNNDKGPDQTNSTGSDKSSDGGSPAGGNGNKDDKSPDGTNPAGSRNIRDNNRGADRERTPDKNKNTCGDPIDVASGDVVLPQVDVELAGVLPLVLRRVHLSSYRVGRFFGPNWASTVDQRLEVDEAGLSFAGDDGTLLFYPHPTPVSLPQAGARNPLALTDDGYTITVVEQDLTLHFGSGGSVLPLRAITDRNGHRIDFDRDEAGVPTEIRHSGGYRIRVESANGLITALHLCGADGGADLALVRYGYQHGLLSEVINGSGKPLRFTYDHAGRITSWTDRNEAWYRYGYDHEGRVVRADGSGGFLSGTMSYEDGVTRWTNSLGHQTAYHLNERGQTVLEVDPLGNEVRSEWDEFDRLRKRTDPLGRSVRYDRDEWGNVLAITRPDGTQLRCDYDESGLPVAFVEADGATTRHTYDESGNLRSTTDACGATTHYSYDEHGNLTAITDALGNTSTVEVDASGLPTAFVDALGAATRYERDRFGRVTAITDPVGGVQRFGWTVGGELAWHERADGTVERRVYDGEGNQREHRDEFAEVSTTEITHFDLVAAETRPDGTRMEFGYDTEMRLVSVTNPQRLVWRYEYDAAGRLVREVDFNGRTLQYAYDAAGQLVERTNGAGEVTRFSLDLLGNVVERRTGFDVARFTLSETGEVLEAVNGASRVVFQRDPVGRVLAETINGRTVTSEYDPLGRRVRRRTPSGAESTWEYDANDQPIALHSAGRTLRFEYDQAGREVRRSVGACLVLGQSWTAAHLLQAQTITGAGGGSAQQRTYAYRADGALTGVQDQLTGPRTFTLDHAGQVLAVQGSGWSERYAYDAAGNITHGSWPSSGNEDEFGERVHGGTLVRAAGGVRYEHDAQGRLVLRQRKHLSHRPETWRYSWDADDRLVGVLTPDGTRWAYRYDAIGRRIAKQRLGTDGTTVLEGVDFTWDGHVLAEQAGYRQGQPGPHVLVWDHEPGSFRPLTQAERVQRGPQDWVNSKFHAIVTDLVGTPTELLDDQGGVSWVHRTTLWGGSPHAESARAGTPLRFPGQYFDAETGMHYNFYRYYDPFLGRYASPDPLGLDGGPNQHAYVRNPHAWADPLGLVPCKTHPNADPPKTAIEKVAGKYGEQEHLNKHIFKGEKGTNGKPTGLHAYENSPGRGKFNADNVINNKTGKSPYLPNDITVLAHRGKFTQLHEIVYTKAGADGPKASTMFPANWSKQDVQAYLGNNNPSRENVLGKDYKDLYGNATKDDVNNRISSGQDIKLTSMGGKDGTVFPDKGGKFDSHPEAVGKSWTTTDPGSGLSKKK